MNMHAVGKTSTYSKRIGGKGGTIFKGRKRFGVKNIWHVLWPEYLNTSQNLYVVILTPKDDGTSGWGLWKVIKS